MENYYLNSPSKQREIGGTCVSDVCPKNDTVQHVSRNMQDAVSYLKRKGIHDIIDSLLGELLLRRPHDPYEYLIQLLHRRILTRDGLVDSPPPFCSRDIIRQAKQANYWNLLTLLESTNGVKKS
ncbi:hypothetical protein ALC56_04268 [Trachymyrmex septentrionalis]|uniref:Uncharacterized protein n=1 Tax=Trachymyrmex septentrionalis TaxID=34720 RepID=A0A195FLI0_9HYME|nr:PREDICTED: uncharacterized protein LOC108746759 [Trachymyrmex septentrionalis]KYN41117.1 hypothetical protein ALC56_04268 [Trachymyrmex septentrionalis]